jgi:hypothetical protein
VPTVIDATIQPATQILNIPVRRVIVQDSAQRVLYRTPDPPRRGLSAANPSDLDPAPTDDLAIFTAPIYLNPLTLATPSAPPTRRLLGQVTLELAAAEVRAGWQRRFLQDLGLVALTLFGAMGVAYYTGQRLSSALHTVVDAIHRIKNGDLDVHLLPMDTHELGTLQEGVNLLAHTLARAQAVIWRSGTGQGARGIPGQALDALHRSRRARPPNRPVRPKACSWPRSRTRCAPRCTRFRGWSEQLLKTTARRGRGGQTLRTLLAAAAHPVPPHQRYSRLYTQLEKGKYAPTLRSALIGVGRKLEAVVAPAGTAG